MIDNAETIFTGQPGSAVLNIQTGKSDLKSISEEDKKSLARDFESLLVTQLLDQMKKSIGDWGFEQDGASEQIHGLFWMYLGQDLSENGGMGLWKEIYKMMNGPEQQNAEGKILDHSI